MPFDGVVKNGVEELKGFLEPLRLESRVVLQEEAAVPSECYAGREHRRLLIDSLLPEVRTVFASEKGLGNGLHLINLLLPEETGLHLLVRAHYASPGNSCEELVGHSGSPL